jgi:hypothetical protein
MITMFMGYQYGIEVCGSSAQLRQASFGFAAGEAAINHHQGRVRLHQRGVASTATAKRCETHPVLLQSDLLLKKMINRSTRYLTGTLRFTRPTSETKKISRRTGKEA